MSGSPAGPCAIALDLGTTSVRALVVDGQGEPTARAYRPLTTRHPAADRVEQDPEEMWARGVEVLREAVDRSGAAARDVRALGVVTQRATVIAWDARTGEPLAPAIGWQDRRTARRVAGFRAQGIPLTTLASATKLEWWMQGEPAVRDAAAKGRLRLGTPDVWLTARLTGGAAHVTDPGNASCTALFDAAGGDWSQPLLDLFSVPREALPEVRATSEVVGETPANLFGVRVPVAARAGDQQASAFAQGLRQPGDAKLTLGTSAVLDLHTGSGIAAPPPGAHPLALWRLADGSRAFCVEGMVITAGAAVEWLVRLGIAGDVRGVLELAASVPDSGGVCFIPALYGLGTPWMDDTVRAELRGISAGSGAAHVARAVLEGVAQRCVDVCDALHLGPAPLRVDGGLARSDLLLARIADLGGRAVHRSAELEATALGAAWLAARATGGLDCPSRAPVERALTPSLDPAAREAERAAWAEAIARLR